MLFVISILSIILTSFSIETEKIKYFSVFSPKKVEFPPNSSALLWELDNYS